jgi:hypothetical protein
MFICLLPRHLQSTGIASGDNTPEQSADSLSWQRRLQRVHACTYPAF